MFSGTTRVSLPIFWLPAPPLSGARSDRATRDEATSGGRVEPANPVTAWDVRPYTSTSFVAGVDLRHQPRVAGGASVMPGQTATYTIRFLGPPTSLLMVRLCGTRNGTALLRRAHTPIKNRSTRC